MTLIFLIVITLFLYFDLGVLKKRNPDAFTDAFTFPRLLWWTYGLLFVLLYPGGDPRDYLLFFMAVFVLPLYVWRRIRYRKFLTQGPSQPAVDEGNTNLALDAFGVILLWFLAMVGLNLIIEGVRWAFHLHWPKLAELVFQSAFSFILAFILILRVLKKHKDLTLSGILGMDQKITFGKHVFLPIVIGLVLALLACGVLVSRPVQPATPLGDILEQTSSSVALIAFLVIATLLAPLFEEIIFRGFFYHVVSSMKGKVFAVILIGAVFGALHIDQYWGDWFSIGVVVVLGFVLTFFRAWTGSCLPSIVMHYIFNGAMTVIPILMLLTSNPSYFQYAFRYPVLEPEAKEQLLRESIRTDPDYAPAYNDLAWLYAEEKRDLAEGLSLVNFALEQDADNYAFLDTKAEVLYQMGRVDEALVIEEALQKRYPNDQYLKDQVKKFLTGPPQGP